MNTKECSSAPLSWLTLEQYFLGELPPEKWASVESHIHECGSCSSAMESIRGDFTILKPLPEIKSKERTPFFYMGSYAMAGAVALLIVSIAVLVFKPTINRYKTTETVQMPPSHISYKGGELALGIIRKRGDNLTQNPRGFIDGDKFAVNITCPPGLRNALIVVFQDGKSYFPIKTEKPVTCENNHPLTGSFELAGSSDVTVCGVVDELPSKKLLSKEGIKALPESSVCLKLESMSKKR
ncbi:MAG: hypothetical protein JXR91_00105 [Deltaproteobacteria bacterium]|nr:hypothetical protein [Deltaproteobacteria bacterium]